MAYIEDIYRKTPNYYLLISIEKKQLVFSPSRIFHRKNYPYFHGFRHIHKQYKINFHQANTHFGFHLPEEIIFLLVSVSLNNIQKGMLYPRGLTYNYAENL